MVACRLKTDDFVLDALLGLGALQEQAGKTENALVLCCYILNHSASEEETKILADQLRADLELKLSSKQIMAARRMAAESSFDEIVKAALEAA